MGREVTNQFSGSTLRSIRSFLQQFVQKLMSYKSHSSAKAVIRSMEVKNILSKQITSLLLTESLSYIIRYQNEIGFVFAW